MCYLHMHTLHQSMTCQALAACGIWSHPSNAPNDFLAAGPLLPAKPAPFRGLQRELNGDFANRSCFS